MGTVIEVGANWGSDTRNLLQGGHKVFAFEPVPEMIVGLQDAFRTNELFHLVPLAVDSEPGWKWFNIANDPSRGVSSLHEVNHAIGELWSGPDFTYADRIRVWATRLDRFMGEQGIGSVDYLWIDAQGNDLRVLESLGDRIGDIKEGQCEAAYTVDLYEGVDNHYTTVVAWLEARGFECAVVPELAMKECDVFFRRRA